jgi:hypothetical protein
MNDEDTRTREAKLDCTLADSFPASDPPSFTPVMGVGFCASDAHPPDKGKRKIRAMLIPAYLPGASHDA